MIWFPFYRQKFSRSIEDELEGEDTRHKGTSQELTTIVKVRDVEHLNQDMGSVNEKEEIFCRHDRQNLVTNCTWGIMINKEE